MMEARWDEKMAWETEVTSARVKPLRARGGTRLFSPVAIPVR